VKNKLFILVVVFTMFLITSCSTQEIKRNDGSWWKYSKEFLNQDNSAIILAIGGKYWHYSTIEKISDKQMYLQDSDGLLRIRKTSCRFPDYKYEDRIVIFPSQCWLIKG